MPLPDFDSIDRGLAAAQDASQRVADATKHFVEGTRAASKMVRRKSNWVERTEGAATWLSSGAKIARLLVPFLRRSRP